jgi:3-oxoacyl-[acyl-carrier protein] reductase
VSADTPAGRLAGRVALVTGAGRGFGRTMAVAFAREGADVVVNYNASAGPAKDAVGEIAALGRPALAVQADVAREDQVRALVERTLDRFGRLDVLVNNAGIMTRGAFAEAPMRDYDAMWAINVTGTFLCTQYALRPMVKARYGRIINLSSQLARAGVGNGGFAAYAATKGAVEGFTRATRRIQELPVRHLGEVEDVAYYAVFLASEQANYLTGQTLQPNGGWVMP